MKGMIDETELARLEYLIEASESCGYSTKLDDPNMQYLAAACHYTPALVAEVRRLRRNYECSEKSLQRHEHMVAELMEKVEAWEWFEECFEVMQWLVPMGPNRGNACEEAVISTLDAQKRAVHADRE